MNRREFLRYSAGGLAALAVGSKVPALLALGCAPTKTSLPKAAVPAGYERIRMVGASIGSASTTGVMVHAALLNKYYPEIEWSSVSGTTTTNVVYVTKGTSKLARGNVAGYVDAYGLDKVPESRLRSISLPASLTQYLFFVPADKPWKDITEVPKGLTLCPGTPGSTVPVVTEAWLQLCGLGKKDFNWVPMAQGSVPDAWREGKIDLTLQTVSGASPWLLDVATSPRKVRHFGLTPEQAAKAKAEKTFERLGLEAPSMSNVTDLVPEVFKYDVICPQQPNFLFSRDDFPEEIAYKMAKIFDEHHAELVQLWAAMKYGTPQWHIRWAKPPYDIHPGVARYYKEKGYLK